MSGYDTKIFVENPDESLICPLCLNVLNDPKQCPNGHCFCGGCIVDALEKRKECPICKVETDARFLSRSLYVQNSIHKLKTVCKSRMNGCQWTGTLSERDSHYLSQCEYRFMKCSNDGCTEKMLKKHIESHLKVCIHRTESCKYCHAILNCRELTVHVAACPNRPIVCPLGCGEFLSSDQISMHIDTFCPSQPVECPFLTLLGECPAKCSGIILRGDCGKHMTAPGRMESAVGLLESKHVGFINEIAKLTQQNAELQQSVAQHQQIQQTGSNTLADATNELFAFCDEQLTLPPKDVVAEDSVGPVLLGYTGYEIDRYWLMTDKLPNSRYIPQVGDMICYFPTVQEAAMILYGANIPQDSYFISLVGDNHLMVECEVTNLSYSTQHVNSKFAVIHATLAVTRAMSVHTQ